MTKRTWYRMALDRGSSTSATIDIFDEIGMFGITAKNFRDDLIALGDVKNITMRINSPGGEVFEAVTMFSLLQLHPAEIDVQVIGLAASSASFLAMVGDTISIAENAYFMIHLPSTIAWGDEKELRKALTMLEKIREQMVRAYSKRTNLDPKDVEEMMSEETWFSADEAVENGLADEVIGAVTVTAAFDARRFASAVPAGAKALFARRNLKEADMATKKTPVDESPEQMEARIREEVRAELTTKAEEDAAEKLATETAAATAAAALAAGNAPVAKTEAEIRAEFGQIADACTIAGVPEKAAGFIAEKKTLTQVMAELKKGAVENLSSKRTNANNSGGFKPQQKLNANNGGGSDANGNDVSGIDVGAVYAKWNSPKRSPRGNNARH